MLAPFLAAVAASEHAGLAAADLPADLLALAGLALSGRGSVLGGDPAPRWARLPLLACASAAGGPPAAAVPLAVAIEFQAGAYSLLDDLHDGECSAVIRRAGPTVALGVATTLLALAQHALLRVPARPAAVMAGGWVRACAGQHRDVTLDPDDADPLDAAMAAAEGKTADVVAAALEAGALLGGADPDLAVRYRRFGHADTGAAGSERAGHPCRANSTMPQRATRCSDGPASKLRDNDIAPPGHGLRLRWSVVGADATIEHRCEARRPRRREPGPGRPSGLHPPQSVPFRHGEWATVWLSNTSRANPLGGVAHPPRH